MDNRLLSPAQVCEILSISRSTLNRIIKSDPTFPLPTYISPTSRRWIKGELDEWISNKASERTEAQKTKFRK